MHLVQILVPLYDNAGHRFADTLNESVRVELTERFGGVTAYTRAPAQGLWKTKGATQYDDIVVLEVMVQTLDVGWWNQYRVRLEQAFRQDAIVIRAQEMTLL